MSGTQLECHLQAIPSLWHVLSTADGTIKHCQFGHRCPAIINDANQADGGEPTGSSSGMACRNSFASGAGSYSKGNGEESERSKKVVAGRAGAAARQKQLLKQFQAAKESLRPPVSAADNDGTSASLKEAKRTDEQPEPNWIPWNTGACLAGVHLRMSLRAKTCACAPVPRRWRQSPRPKPRINLPS